MRRFWRWTLRLAGIFTVLVIGLLLPVAYTELACQGQSQPEEYTPVLTDPAWRRHEARTLLTYPEWHIVHAYDDYAEVIRKGDPHDFDFLRAIGGYWSSLCIMSEAASAHGGVTTESKQLVYTIGVSFTAELFAKAAYEETLGRLFAAIDGETRAPLEDLRAAQAAKYAQFLQQTPWYKWRFRDDAAALAMARTDRLRDKERAIALGLELRAKAAYARGISAAVASVGADETRIRSVVTGLTAAELAEIGGVDVVGALPEGVVIETQRYRAFTAIASELVDRGATFVEIAGNDHILLTATAPPGAGGSALYRFPRQGYGDERHLMLVQVVGLAQELRALKARGMTLEHIHDY